MRSLFYLLFLLSCAAHAQIITTVAGGDSVGLGDGGPATACELYHPIGIAFDAAGNYYITDRDHNRICKVNTAGIITTIAGVPGMFFNGDNIPATAAVLSYPYGIALDAAGNIYYADGGFSRIRKINTAGIITTIAGTGTNGYNGDNIAATAAQIFDPGGVAFDTAGNIYFADGHNFRVRKIDKSGIITTVAGTGSPGYNGDNIPATNAELNVPSNLSVDMGGNIYVADYDNGRIRKIDRSGIIHTIAGDSTQGYSGDNGPATAAELNRPLGVYADVYGNIYIGDTYNNVIRKINAGGIISTIAGTGAYGFSGDGGLATLADLNEPIGITMDASGDIYFSDFVNNRIRRLSSTVSVPQINRDNEIKVYPNPSIGNFTISISSATDEPVQVTISDLMGKVLKTIPAVTNRPENVTLDAPAGTFLLSALTQKASWVERIVIAK